MDAAISLRNVALSFGAHRVLDDLTLSVAPGSITALLGGNGAGKLTTLSLLLGFAHADEGETRVCGLAPAAAPDAVRLRSPIAAETTETFVSDRSQPR